MKQLLFLSSMLLLTACGSNNNDNPAPVAPPAPPPEVTNAGFEVSIVNLTAAQPLSPVTVFIHNVELQLFAIGESASAELEVLAEAGDNSQLLDSVDASAEASGSAPLGPGASESLSLELDGDDTSGLRLTLLTMLVNTNDAFTGINAVDISALEVGQSMTLNGRSYDAGTEANTEAADSIPGPAGGGEGFNAVRDDIADQVTGHGGAVTLDDGLSGSALNHTHRWDNPVAQFRITRTQ
ncbi:MAG: spondin domain-containing protein [Gammaproteobacteria bacterium]|nr:spondin domain-containing protein [Gammaproteobacteria bacterium]